MSELEDVAWDALDRIPDPCMLMAGRDLSIRDMGIIRRVTSNDGVVTVELCFTDPHCMQEIRITSAIEAALRQIQGVSSVLFEIACSPVWSNERLSERARAQFALDRAERLRRAGRSA